jgi:hypothetical protein
MSSWKNNYLVVIKFKNEKTLALFSILFVNAQDKKNQNLK